MSGSRRRSYGRTVHFLSRSRSMSRIPPTSSARRHRSLPGSRLRHRSHVRALGVGAVVAGLVGVGVTFAVAAEPSAGSSRPGRGRPGTTTPPRCTRALAPPPLDTTTARPTPTRRCTPPRYIPRRCMPSRATRHPALAVTAQGCARRAPCCASWPPPAGRPLASIGWPRRGGRVRAAARRRAAARVHRRGHRPRRHRRHPAMGIHWVNGGLLDGTVSARSPEVLVYEPRADGS